MRINTINHIKSISTINKRSNVFDSSLRSDVVSFSAMKKSQFSGIDLFVVNRFKAPIEKFNCNQDLQDWCLNKVDKDYSYDKFKSDDKGINKKRKSMLDDWKNYILEENDDYNNAVLLMAMQGTSKHLKNTNHELPLTLNKGVLAKTIFDIKTNLKKNQKMTFDFNKVYSNNLVNYFLDEDEPVSDITGWVIIPSKKRDSGNFKENVEKVRSLSHKTWCTKTNNALPYLLEGDFHVYLEEGQPKLAVRFSKDKVREIQGELNDGAIPYKYADICMDHLKGFSLEYDAQLQVENLARRKDTLAKVKVDLADAIKENDVEKIFNYFGVKVEKSYSPIKELTEDKKELYKIEKYSAFQDGISFADMGIDENKLFEKIDVIEGNVDFCGSELSDLGALTHILGNANFESSKIKDLKNLFAIEGNAEFKNSNVRSLGNLRIIEGNADFENSYLTSLNKLQKIGGNARFNNSKISDLGDLKYIGGYANFTNSDVNDYNYLEYIGGEIIDSNGRFITNSTMNIIANIIDKLSNLFSSFKK